MKLWRIAAETRKYAATDMHGSGAALYPGRWNDEGEPVVYAAPTIAMAVLETAAHLAYGGLPLNRYLVEIEVPDAIWESREQVDPNQIAPTWAAIPAGAASVKIGSDWLASLSSAILLVPSVLVPEEPVTLINPRHPGGRKINARVLRRFEYNCLFRPAPAASAG